MGYSTLKASMGMLAICLCLTSVAVAQPMRHGRMYNPQTVETVSGEVTKIEQVSYRGPMGYGVHLILKTEDGDVSVRLGPSGYLSNVGLNVAEGDTLTVTGSMVTRHHDTFLIASEVVKGDDTFVLRDRNGFPMWSGWYR